MPTGPLNRIADNALAQELLGWRPKVVFRDGLRRTVDWYLATRNREEVARILKEGGLLKRRVLTSTPPS